MKVKIVEHSIKQATIFYKIIHINNRACNKLITYLLQVAWPSDADLQVRLLGGSISSKFEASLVDFGMGKSALHKDKINICNVNFNKYIQSNK